MDTVSFAFTLIVLLAIAVVFLSVASAVIAGVTWLWRKVLGRTDDVRIVHVNAPARTGDAMPGNRSAVTPPPAPTTPATVQPPAPYMIHGTYPLSPSATRALNDGDQPNGNG